MEGWPLAESEEGQVDFEKRPNLARRSASRSSCSCAVLVSLLQPALSCPVALCMSYFLD